MDNAQKALIIGISLFLTILLISVVLLINNSGLSTIKKSGDQVSQISASLEKQLITQYDQRILTGQDVANAIDNYNTKLDGYVMVSVGDTKFIRGYNLKKKIKPYKISNSKKQILMSPKVNPGIIEIENIINFRARIIKPGFSAAGFWWGPR